MGRGERFSDKTKSSPLFRAAESVLEHKVSILNALDFIESTQGLNVTLYPVQRVLIRCTFGVPFDYKPQRVPVWDKFHHAKLWDFSEAEFIHWLHEEGRCNISDWKDIPEGGFNEICAFAGRRGGKSQAVSAVGGYALYKLLNVRSPQEWFNLREGSRIDFTMLAQDDEGANRLYDKLREDVNQAPFFGPFQKTSTNTEMTFVSEADRHKQLTTGTIKVKSYPCTTNAARGLSSVFLALDEFAHYRSAKGSSSDEVYAAAKPSTANFRHKEVVVEDDLAREVWKRDSLIMSISSPWKKVGKMFELHKLAMDKGIASGIFTMRVSTAEMNPYIDEAFLRQEYLTNPQTWKAEYGGDFLESSETYVSEAQLRSCVETERTNVVAFHPKYIGRQFFWGIDLGMTNDATAVAIGHLEYKAGGKIEGTQATGGNIQLIYDYIDRMMVGEKFDGPGVPPAPHGAPAKYVNYQVLPLEDIISWLFKLQQLLPCFRGATDQHGGQQLVQLLEINGIANVELLNLTPSINSQMYFALRGYIEQSKCRFPNHEKFISEVKQLEAEYTNKYQIRVEAPIEKGSHDDMGDAAAIVALLASDWMQNEGHLSLDPSGSSLMMNEQLLRPPGAIINVEAVSMQDLRIMERQRKIQSNMGLPNIQPVRNPYVNRRRR